MTNYYDILGVKNNAGQAEIKTAFRRLAKQYHPDKNPEGRERFSIILKAYETLCDPVLKSAYDYKLNYHLGQSRATPPKAQQEAATKNWRFDEKEMKRRQYFNEHYKKGSKTTAEYVAEVESKSSYNEYKYILFATPIAVALFLLIMHLAMPDQSQLAKGEIGSHEPAAQTSTVSQLSMGDMPYSTHFGGARYDPAFQRQLTVENRTGKEAIVCLFTETAFVRSFYIRKGYFAEVSQLPGEPLFVRYSTGMYFRHSAGASGAFTQDVHYFTSDKSIRSEQDQVIALQQTPANSFREINEVEFFKTTN